MSDDEVMRFEITDDDLNNEFNYDLKRPKMSKNQATYGIWADDSDGDDDPGKFRSKKNMANNDISNENYQILLFDLRS